MSSRDRAEDAAQAGLGQRIRDARVALGMTQGELAGNDYSVGYISRIESGDRRPSREALVAIAGRLTVSVDFLETGQDGDLRRERTHDLDGADMSLAAGEVDSALSTTAALLDSGVLAPFPDLELRSLYIHARAQEAAGDVHQAIIELEDLRDRSEDTPLAVQVALALSRCYRETEDFEQAISAGERQLTSLETKGLTGTADYVRLAMTVAGAHYEAGQLGLATRLARRGIAAAEAISSPEAQAAAYWNASIFERDNGHLERAIDLASRALGVLENGDSTRNLARLRTQLALFHLRDPHADLVDTRRLLELAAQEMKWSSASPVDQARNEMAFARLLIREGRGRQALERLASVPPGVCHQEPSLSAELRVIEVIALVADEAPVEEAYLGATNLLDLLGSDRGIGQLWFELGEAMAAYGDKPRAAQAYRQASVCLGASRVLMPIYDRTAYSLSTLA
ncbi:MAG: helix-turn-helix domain-containing protein [Nocardioidaceae bacterium]|nr:helix-turn-helix domain-containing protein [Nocardioidaceae bacterium]